MTNEEFKEYQTTLTEYIDSAQYEYRCNHPNCLYCECIQQGYWSWDYICRITSQKFNTDYETDQRKAKRKARRCKYYFPKTDLS